MKLFSWPVKSWHWLFAAWPESIVDVLDHNFFTDHEPWTKPVPGCTMCLLASRKYSAAQIEEWLAK